MGDRANIFLVDDQDPKTGALRGIYLYDHSSGIDSLTDRLRSALVVGRPRWGDEQYLARIIASRVFAGQHDQLTGAGLSTMLCDNEYPICCVDLRSSEVGVADEGAERDRGAWEQVRSFAEFIQEPATT